MLSPLLQRHRFHEDTFVFPADDARPTIGLVSALCCNVAFESKLRAVTSIFVPVQGVRLWEDEQRLEAAMSALVVREMVLCAVFRLRFIGVSHLNRPGAESRVDVQRSAKQRPSRSLGISFL